MAVPGQYRFAQLWGILAHKIPQRAKCALAGHQHERDDVFHHLSQKTFGHRRVNNDKILILGIKFTPSKAKN